MGMLKILGFSRRWRLVLWYCIAPCHKPGQHNITFCCKRLVVFRYSVHVGRDSVVGIYGLDGPGIQSPWGKVFHTRPDRPCGPPSLLYSRYRVIPEGKRPRCGVDRAPPCGAEVKERVELCLYSLSVPSWQIIEWTFTFTVLILYFIFIIIFHLLPSDKDMCRFTLLPCLT